MSSFRSTFDSRHQFASLPLPQPLCSSLPLHVCMLRLGARASSMPARFRLCRSHCFFLELIRCWCPRTGVPSATGLRPVAVTGAIPEGKLPRFFRSSWTRRTSCLDSSPHPSNFPRICLSCSCTPTTPGGPPSLARLFRGPHDTACCGFCVIGVLRLVTAYHGKVYGMFRHSTVFCCVFLGRATLHYGILPHVLT